MKKNIFILTLISLLSSCSNNNAAQENSNSENVAANRSETIKVGFFSSATGNAPLNYVDEHGKIQGFEYDILQEIAKRNNYNFEYEYRPRNYLFDNLENKQYRILSGNIGITKERTNRYAMSMPYLDAYPITIVSKNKNIKSLEDLKNKSVSIKDSPMDNFYTVLNAHKEDKQLNIHYTGSDWLAIKSVLKDETTAAVSNSFVIPYFVDKYSEKTSRCILQSIMLIRKNIMVFY